MREPLHNYREERGRELHASELKPRMVVLLGPEQGALISIKVSAVDPVRHSVRFYAPAFALVVEYRYDQRGEFYSATGQRVHVYEFLGEIERTN